MLWTLTSERPKKPIFPVTRGYAEKLWGMTKSCWKQDPNERPTAYYVLDILRNATEWLQSKRGELSAPSPLMTGAQFPSRRGQIYPPSPNPRTILPTIATSILLNPPQPLIIKTPVPAPAQARSSHSVHPRPFASEVSGTARTYSSCPSKERDKACVWIGQILRAI